VRSLPDGVTLRRVTDELTAATLPAGLRRAHQVADGAWARLCVRAGEVRFVRESPPESVTVVAPGQPCVIEPSVLHHVEPSADARFVVEFYR